MASATILVPVATNLLAAAIAIAVGLQLARHRPDGDAGRAVSRFSAWWIGLAAFIVLNQMAVLAGLAGLSAPLLFAGLSYASNVALMTCLWGLVSYVLYLFTGRSRVFPIVTLAYLVQLAAILVWIASLGPRGILLSDAGTQTVWTRDPSPNESGLFALAFLLPPILSSLALGALSFRTSDRTSRYRMRAIGVGIFIWFTGAILITASGAPAATTSIVGPIAGTLCMLLIVSAYRPPLWLQRRGIQPFGDAPRGGRDSDERLEAFARRVRELV